MPIIVTLLTDFGTADGYVAEVKGTILSGAPGVVLIDVAHDLEAQDVEGGRLALARYWRRFPPGTIHLAVVDPDVGTARRAIAIASDDRYLVGPDNGVLSPALLVGGARAVVLAVPTHASPTFHARDVFAPAVAMLASGATIDALGNPIGDPVIRRTVEARRLPGGAIEGRIITVDRFGNAVTNLVAVHGGAIEIGATLLPIRRTYADVEPGSLVALSGSSGLVEIAVRDGSAAMLLGLRRGGAVLLQPARS